MTEGDVEPLLEYLKRTRGFDFTGYKRTSLERRIEHRARRAEDRGLRRVPGTSRAAPGGVPVPLQHDPDQRHVVLPRPGRVGLVAKEVVPQLLEGKPEDEPFRVWCAGMRVGRGGVHGGHGLGGRTRDREYCERVKIYGTDVDEDALTTARHGIYDAKQLEPVPPELRRPLLRADERQVHLPRRSAAHGHLRPQRPRAGRADLPRRPADMPQRADLLHRRGPDQDPRAAELRPPARGRSRRREVRDARQRRPSSSGRRT